eukprot:EG_transcript_23371
MLALNPADTWGRCALEAKTQVVCEHERMQTISFCEQDSCLNAIKMGPIQTVLLSQNPMVPRLPENAAYNTEKHFKNSLPMLQNIPSKCICTNKAHSKRSKKFLQTLHPIREFP